MVIMTTRMSVSPRRKKKLASSLRGMLEPVRRESGCLGFDLYVDTEDQNTYILVEEWETKEDFDRHLRGGDYRRFLVLMELLKEPPEISISLISQRSGMEYLEQVIGLH
jgi:quinol monooxygenase YgiN